MIMLVNSFRKEILVLCLLLGAFKGLSQDQNLSDYVNPFIGTGRTNIKSFWGAEGGTYPGAVAPWGFVQLTPETDISSAKGYNYRDSSIYFFSCAGHMSGYPNGSSGHIHIMPVDLNTYTRDGKYSRPFSHDNEEASPGYYKVIFSDNGTVAEASASVRTGMFRFTFPSGTAPAILISDIGKPTAVSDQIIRGSRLNTVIRFSRKIKSREDSQAGTLLTFSSNKGEKTIITITIAVSTVSHESSQKNLKTEAGSKTFSEYLDKNRSAWDKALSVISAEDPDAAKKTVFYSALYHSFLVPWTISDVDGWYTGADGKIHRTGGKDQYGAFSPWDTFRSLHPLLCLVAPDRQRDMIYSMLDYYRQQGRLPGGPMTGNHIIAVMADSWSKGIRGYDSTLALRAMTATLDSAYAGADMAAYMKLGYVPGDYSESVTRTVEYAYDDWVMGELLRRIMPNEKAQDAYIERSFNYRNILDPVTLFLVPRSDNNYIREPANFGYKEGDKHSYSLFVPHNPVDLVNLTGGPEEFAARLDSSLANDLILFDNETVLHVPYLFNYAKAPYETQRWVRNIMRTHYTDSPGGIPGNDDLGAMSSWFVFSAMGFYPVCPGRPAYDLGSPLLQKVIIHLPDKNTLTIRSENNSDRNIFVNSVLVNGSAYNANHISHDELISAKEIVFGMTDKPVPGKTNENTLALYSETGSYSHIQIRDFKLPVSPVESGEPFMVIFTASNTGSTGAKKVRIFTDGKEYTSKNIIVGQGEIITDSIECILYPAGISQVQLEGMAAGTVEVHNHAGISPGKVSVSSLTSPSLVRSGDPFFYSVDVMNRGGYKERADIKIFINDSLAERKTASLEPGESSKITCSATLNKPGIYTLRAGNERQRIRIYSRNNDAVITDLPLDQKAVSDTASDISGLNNNGIIRRHTNQVAGISTPFKTGDSCYLELGPSPALDNPGKKITVMAWVFPGENNRGLRDIITRGDFIALQSSGNRTLSFFAGGWGRGSCECNLPADWTSRWHHIAGVSDGYTLKLYIDGEESASFSPGSPVDLAHKSLWTIGRNQEFPGERIFHGTFRNVRIYQEALSPSEIKQEMYRK
jgi:putative alpha-1,2-mannosidase